MERGDAKDLLNEPRKDSKPAVDTENFSHSELFVQPIYSMKLSKVVGVESLVREKESNRVYKDNTTSTSDLLKIISEYNGTEDFDIWCINRIITFIKENDFIQRNHIKINVNLSAETIGDTNAIIVIAELIHSSHMEDTIVIELNEDSLFWSLAIKRNIMTLKENKLTVSLDDFNKSEYEIDDLLLGMVDQIKLDYVKQLNNLDNKLKAELSKYKELAETNNASIIIEGVEEQDQIAFLNELGLDLIQGYCVSKPFPLKEFTEEKLGMQPFLTDIHQTIQFKLSDYINSIKENWEI